MAGIRAVALVITNHFRGFSLIEVLVALVILGVGLAAASRAASVSTDSARETRLRTLATWVAQNRIAELTATRSFPATGSMDGRSTLASTEFEWKQITYATPNPTFRKVELQVLRPGQAQTLVSLNAYLTQGQP